MIELLISNEVAMNTQGLINKNIYYFKTIKLNININVFVLIFYYL